METIVCFGIAAFAYLMYRIERVEKTIGGVIYRELGAGRIDR